jgi:hypothetical protein
MSKKYCASSWQSVVFPRIAQSSAAVRGSGRRGAALRAPKPPRPLAAPAAETPRPVQP